MRHKQLAKLLTDASNSRERRRILAKFPGLTDAELARQIRLLCYEAWATEPSRARRTAAAARLVAEISGDREAHAHSLWITGISEITKGRLNEAAEILEHAYIAFSALGRLTEAAQVLVAKLIPLAMTGRYDVAEESGNRALAIFAVRGDELAAGKIEMNLSNIASRRERHRDAERYGLSALGRFERAGEKKWQIMAMNDLANTYTDLNEFRRAESIFEAALSGAQNASMTVTEAEIEANLGNLETYRGNYGNALHYLELSRTKYDTLGMPHQSAIAELEIADIYGELGLLTEAVSIYKRIVPTFRQLKLRTEEARARMHYGNVIARLGSHRSAEKQWRAAVRIFDAEENALGAGRAKLALARAALARSDDQTARELVRQARRTLGVTENPRHHLEAILLEAEIEIECGSIDKADALLADLADRARRLEQRRYTLSALNAMGRSALSRGKRSTAKSAFKKAAAIAEALRAPLAGEEFRMAVLAATIEPFENLSRIFIKERKFAEALRWVERARSRSIADSMIANDPTEARRPDALASKASDLRERLNWLYSRLDRGEALDNTKLTQESRRLERQLSDLTRRIGSSLVKGAGSDHLRHVTGDFDIENLQKQLGKRRALIEFVEHDGWFSAFTVSDSGIDYVEKIVETKVISADIEALRFQFDSLRYGAANLAGLAQALKRRADAILERLYQRLFSRLETSIGDRNLVIVPSGVLNYVPFQALRSEATYLIETREIVRSPSAAIWQTLANAGSRRPRGVLLIGFADESIPLVDSEIETLSRVFPDADAYTGESSTFAAYMRMAPGKRVIHIACHGTFRSDNPLYSSLHLADGWVTVNDIRKQKLNAELVTLSACETGLNAVGAGEEIFGLARGFLSAGARNILLSLWAVNDVSASHMMQSFYAAMQRGDTIAASLRNAQIEQIKRGEHPYFWAPYYLIGK